MNTAHIANLVFVYSLCLFWSAVQIIRMLFEIIRHGPSAFFNAKPRPNPPAALTHSEWTHKRIKLSVRFFNPACASKSWLLLVEEVSLHYVEAGGSVQSR